MRATTVGLGLANFTVDGLGMNLTFNVQPGQFLVGGNYPSSLTFANQGLGTAQFPTETWIFQFVPDTPPPSAPTNSPDLDSQGNVLISRHTIQVPLPTGFSTADALAALAKSMEEQGF